MDTGELATVVVAGASRMSKRDVIEAAALPGFAWGLCAIGLGAFDPDHFSLFTVAGLKHAGTVFVIGFCAGVGLYLKGLYRTLPEAWAGEERRK